MLELTRETFALEGGSEQDLERAAKVAVGLDKLTDRFALDGLTYYYRGLEGNRYERLGAGLILGKPLVTARGFPASGDGDLKTCLAMMTMDRLRAGGSFTEFHAMEFFENFVLMGHDGPGQLAISDRKPLLRGLGVYHGKRGCGVSVEFTFRPGPVTVLAMTQTADGHLKMICAEGEFIPGPILRIGKTDSRLQFALGPAEFVKRWCEESMTHHCALGGGHNRGALAKLSELTGIPLATIGWGEPLR